MLLTNHLHRDGTYEATKLQGQNANGSTYGYASFPYIPYANSFITGPQISSPTLSGMKSALKRMHRMLNTMEIEYPRKKTIVVANVGAWLLQGASRKIFTARGEKQTISERELSTAQLAAEYKSLFKKKRGKKVAIEDVYNAKYLGDIVSSALLKAHPEKQRNAMWMWRATYPIFSSHKRFAPETDEEYRPYNATRRRKTRDGNRVYVDDYNEAIKTYNKVIEEAISETDIIYADAFDAILPQSGEFTPAIDSYSGIHVNDMARKVALQIVLNAIAVRTVEEEST